MYSMKWVAAIALALGCPTAAAQVSVPPEPPTTPAAPPATHELTAGDVDAWLDGYLPYALATGDIAGAVVAVVKDGQIVSERGYGYSDVGKRAPVDPKLTLFRPGSVSKLVTWTAVMQQVEQGKIDLDADINKYLDFQIPARDGKPITMRNLMQHVAGFEEQAKGILSHDPAAQKYEELLKQWTPERVFAAGSTPAYSNYGASLAGYIVQRVSGEAFDDYVDKHIFVPLDMKHSTFRQPLPKELEPLMSKGYVLGSGEPSKFELVGPAPAGAMSSSGDDMAHFMIAHLQNGEYNGNRILREDTAKQMHDSPLTMLPPLNRMELGFFETNINGREVIAHLGDTQNFHTSLHLFLKENTGFYVSFNSPGKAGAVGGLRGALFEQFADRYFPGPGPSNEDRVDDATARKHAQMMSGYWENSRGSKSTFIAAIRIFGQSKVAVGPKGELVTEFKGLNGLPIKWVETAPFLWKDSFGHARLAAKLEGDRVVRFSVDGISPFMVFDRPAASQDASWLLPLLYFALVVLVLTVVSWPIAAILRRVYRAPLELSRRELAAYRLGKLGALVVVAALAAWAITLLSMFADFNKLGPKFDSVVHACQIFGFLAFVGGLVMTLWNLRIVWGGQRRWPARVWSVLLVLAAAIVLYIAFAFHLISWGVNY